MAALSFCNEKGWSVFLHGKTETSMMLGTPVKATDLAERPGVAKREDAAGTQKSGSYRQYLMS